MGPTGEMRPSFLQGVFRTLLFQVESLVWRPAPIAESAEMALECHRRRERAMTICSLQVTRFEQLASTEWRCHTAS